MTAIAQPSADTSASSRQRSLVEAISSMRGRLVKVTLDGFFLTLGALCLPIGIVTIILGWYGAAHTGHVYEQNDYLISGGLLGLGIIFIGGFLYFGYWMTRQIRATETAGQQMLRALERLQGNTGGGVSAGAGSGTSATGEVLVVTEHGSMLHRPTCPAVAERRVRIVDRTQTADYQPCAVCQPLV
jgi:hypothetical protein